MLAPPKRAAHVVASLSPAQLIAGANEETLGVRALLDGKDGPRALFVQGPMPSSQASRAERHRSWMEFNGVSARGSRLVQWPGPPADSTAPAVMCASRGGEFVAVCHDRQVEVKRLEWTCDNVPQADRKKWKGAKPTPKIPFEGVPGQLWLSDDARALAVLMLDPADPSHRELFLIVRPQATAEWKAAGVLWLQKPELAPPHKAQGLNLSAQDMYLGVVSVVFTDTAAMGHCCHVAHTWRRIDEGNPYSGDTSQLLVYIRALCIKLDGAEFKKKDGGQLQLFHADSWVSYEQPFNIGNKDAIHPPLAAQLDPRGSILAVAINQAELQPFLFIAMPGSARKASLNAEAGGTETPVAQVDLRAFQSGHGTTNTRPIQDLEWSCDGSLVAAVTADAHLLLLSRLGLPLPLIAKSATPEMQKPLNEFVRPPPRAPNAASVTMPHLAKRISLAMCPIASMYPYFALTSAAPSVAELGNGVGTANGGVSSQGSQTAESTASGGGGDTSALLPQIKMQLFTICAHGKKPTDFAICDGSVTVVVSTTALEIRDESGSPKVQKSMAFSGKTLVEVLSDPRAPRMASWPADFLPSFVRAAQAALALGDPLDPSAIKGTLQGISAKLKQRSQKGDLVPLWVKLHANVLMSRPDAAKLGPWKKHVKLPWPAPDGWLHRTGRQLVLNDARHVALTLVCASDAQAVSWEKAIRAAASGLTFRMAASLLRCSRKVLQVLVWGQHQPPYLALALIRLAFDELVSVRQLYLAFHLLCSAEHYLCRTSACPITFSKQWETLRQKVDATGRAWNSIEAKDSFGMEDPFWGYKDPVEKGKMSWDPLKTVVALRASGSDSIDGNAALASQRAERLAQLRSVADKSTFKPTMKECQYLAIGHRMYYEKRWDCAREAYTMAGKYGKEALFSLHVCLLDFSAALKLAIAGLHPSACLDHVDYSAGAPNVKGNFAIVYTMARLMHAVLTAKAKFEMWRPTENLPGGTGVPAMYKDAPKWYDALRKRVFAKAAIQKAAKACQDSGDTQWNASTAVKLCFSAGLTDEATAILQKQPTLKAAMGLVLRSHPDIVNHAAAANRTLIKVIEKHLDDALRECDLLRIDKLLKAGTKLFTESVARPHRLDVVKHFLRGIRQYLIKCPVPVVDTFHLPAPLERGLNKIENISTTSPAQEESARRWNIGVAIRFCSYMIQPAMKAGKIRQILGDHGWSGASAASSRLEEGEVDWITSFGTWGDFVLPFRLLTRYLWYQYVRDEYSKRWRQVHRLHSRRTTALARLRRGESLSYHRGIAAVDENELKDERVGLCCAAVQLLPFDDIIHINKLHEMLVTCIESIEREVVLNDAEDEKRLMPLCTLLMVYLPEFGYSGRRRHQVLRKQIAVRCTVLDKLLVAAELDASRGGLSAEQLRWSSRLTQQTDQEITYGMWNYELDREFQLFVSRYPQICQLEETTKFDFAPGPKLVSTEYDLKPAKLQDELQKLKAEYETVSNGEPLVKGAGGQWVLAPEEVGYENLDVAEWDASKNKQQEFVEIFEDKETAATRQNDLAYPVVQMKEGMAVGPEQDVGDANIGDMTRTKQKPASSSAQAPPACSSRPKVVTEDGLRLLSRQGMREVKVGKTAASSGFFTSTFKALRQDGPHARARRTGGKTASVLPPAGGVHGSHTITEPVPHRLQAKRPEQYNVMRAGEPLPSHEYNVDPNTGAIVATDGANAEYPVASLGVRGPAPHAGWHREPPHRAWRHLDERQARPRGGQKRRGRRYLSSSDSSSDEDSGTHSYPNRAGSTRSSFRHSTGRHVEDDPEVLTLHVGPTLNAPLRPSPQSAGEDISADFIREMAGELGVSPARLELIMR